MESRWRAVITGSAFLLLLLAKLWTSPALADHLALDAGFLSSATFPFGKVQNEKYIAFGFEGRASYEFSRWSIGVSSRGQLSLSAPFQFTTDGYGFSGDLARRHISVGLVGRYFIPLRPDGERIYFLAGFYGVQSDLVDASNSFDFVQEDGQESLFIRGYGVLLGGGYRFRGSRLFLELNYEYQKYDWAQVVGKQKLLNYVITEDPLDGGIFAHVIILNVGIADIF